jgi:hypothetical protein
MAERRTELLTIRMSMRERGEAQTVADRRGVSVAELVRQFLKSEMIALGEKVGPAFVEPHQRRARK